MNKGKSKRKVPEEKTGKCFQRKAVWLKPEISFKKIDLLLALYRKYILPIK